jgi:hypothetical protein
MGNWLLHAPLDALQNQTRYPAKNHSIRGGVAADLECRDRQPC